MNTIHIRTIPHAEQRYPTIGDWEIHESPLIRWKGMRISVSDLGDWRMNMLVAVHELVEALLCHHRRISQNEVDAFDHAHADADEPGDLPDAPYRREHCFASGIERLLAAELGVEWADYESRVAAL